jgi:hypothetical protein
VPAAKALAGEKEPPPPAEGEEAAEAEAEAEEAPSAEAVAAAATLEAALGSLVGKLGAPEELRQSLAEWGLKAASRGLGCGEPFDKLGEALVTALQEALGADEATDGAWRELYAQASVVMQAQYTPGQVAEAKAEVEARAKAAAEAEAAAAEAAAAQE